MPSRDNQLMFYSTFKTNKVVMLVGTNKKDLCDLKHSMFLHFPLYYLGILPETTFFK